MTDTKVSGPVINFSISILALGIEGPNETNKPLTFGSRTVIAKRLFERKERLQKHKYRGHYSSMLDRLRPDGSITHNSYEPISSYCYTFYPRYSSKLLEDKVCAWSQLKPQFKQKQKKYCIHPIWGGHQYG